MERPERCSTPAFSVSDRPVLFFLSGEKREASERMPGMSTMFMTFMYVVRIRLRWFQVRSCVLRIDRDIGEGMSVKCWTLQLRDGEMGTACEVMIKWKKPCGD